MTQEKQKAIDLIQKMYENIPEKVFDTSLNHEALHELCRQSALICVDQIIDTLSLHPPESLPLIFWQSVRKEIEKI